MNIYLNKSSESGSRTTYNSTEHNYVHAITNQAGDSGCDGKQVKLFSFPLFQQPQDCEKTGMRHIIQMKAEKRILY